MHAIWALASLDDPPLDTLLRMARSDPDARVRAQAVRAVADLVDPVLTRHKLDAGRGDAEVAERLAAAARGQDRRVVLEIVIALGRLRWIGARTGCGRTSPSPTPPWPTRPCRRCGARANWPAILKLLDEPSDQPLRAIALRAVAERFEPTVVDGLIERLGTETDALRAARVRGCPDPRLQEARPVGLLGLSAGAATGEHGGLGADRGDRAVPRPRAGRP